MDNQNDHEEEPMSDEEIADRFAEIDDRVGELLFGEGTDMEEDNG